MPIFLLDKAIGVVRSAKAFLNPQGGAERRKERVENRKRARQRKSEKRQTLKSKKRDAKQELYEVKKDLHAAKVEAEKGKAERPEQMKRVRKKRQELLQLKSELQAPKGRMADGAPRVVGEPEMGALPDFVVIGPGRSGTTFFYRLLGEHPYVQPAAKKELHFFDLLVDEGAQWYQRWFPAPRLKDGRWTITGEATPTYIFHPEVPERMAKVIPRARLIALLRNPVDRAYSAYHHRVSTGRESRTFEEAIGADFDDGSLGLLSRGIYVDQLVRWLEFFPREQLLVLKSEGFFESPIETLKVVLEFLDLPEWEPEASKLANKRNEGRYEEMDPSTRRRLEEYFEPHNQRLYELLGVDFRW